MTCALGHILLVDDDAVTNLMHERLIARRGLARRVDIVTDGGAAFDYLQARLVEETAPPDLILLDINMPRMNGFEFLAALADLPMAFRAQQRIVMVSTSTLRRDHARADAHPDVCAFAAKPLGADDMERIVRDHGAPDGFRRRGSDSRH